MSSKFAFKMAANDEANNFYKGMDAYQILEIPRTADKKEIKSAYRKLIAKWHPDKFPDDEGKKKEGGLRMEKINRAYFCLGDDDRKKRYDMYGEQGVGTSAASEEQLKEAGGPGMGGFGYSDGGSVDVQDISDIFDAFFGGRGPSRGGAGGGGARKRNNGPVPGFDIRFQQFIRILFVNYNRISRRGSTNGSRNTLHDFYIWWARESACTKNGGMLYLQWKWYQTRGQSKSLQLLWWTRSRN